MYNNIQWGKSCFIVKIGIKHRSALIIIHIKKDGVPTQVDDMPVLSSKYL